MSDNKTLNTGTSGNTSPELVARDEQVVGLFFAGFAIQYFLHKDMLNNKLSPPNFLNIFSDMEVFATQRMFVKNLIGNKKYIKVVEELQSIFLEFCSDPNKNPHPYLLFLSRINKAYLIKHIFAHNGSVPEKYQFIDEYLNKEQVDLDKLNTKIWHFPVEQQILVLARIYSTISDGFIEKKKTVLNSYRENLQRLLTEIEKNPSRYQPIQINNLNLFKQVLNEYDEAITQRQMSE